MTSFSSSDPRNLHRPYQHFKPSPKELLKPSPTAQDAMRPTGDSSCRQANTAGSLSLVQTPTKEVPELEEDIIPLEKGHPMGDQNFTECLA